MALRAARNVDLAVLLLALPLFAAAGLPLAGYAIGAGAWLLQRGIRAAVARRAEASDDPRTRVGLLTGSMIARGWAVAGVIFGVGLATSDEAGLSGAILFLVTFTIWFTIGLLLRPFEKGGPFEHEQGGGPRP